ncbi:MAG TPA: hypothetical protein VLE49_18670 [Anaerolineales bacterium]|nr:hypothetical protein [Anaerolineales bacterium]
MNEELTSFIIKELDRHHHRRKIIQKVCEKGGLHWKEAERLFILIEARHKNTAVIPQTPVLLFWSIGMLIIGIGLLAYNTEILFVLFQENILGQTLSLQGNSYRMIGLFAGAGITAVGMASLWKALGSIFPNC